MRPAQFILVLSLLVAASRLEAEVAALNLGNHDQTITSERIINMLLGRTTTWADGTPVIVIISEEASADAAMQSMIGRDSERLLRGWKRLVYAGNGAMPTIARTNAEALELVAKLPGSIAILPSVTSSACRIIPMSPPRD